MTGTRDCTADAPRSHHLDPGDSLSEVLFGLIMTLSFTLGAGLLVQDGPGAVRELLVATIGCNLAWGIIDGVFYVNGQIFERARLARIGRAVRNASDETRAATLIGNEFDALLEIGIPESERRRFCLQIAAHLRASAARPVRLRADDLRGALANFLLVFGASVPAAIPFLLIDDAWTALRVSNVLLLALLFLAGLRWARYTVLHPVATGTVFLLAGSALVAVAIVLGG